MAIHEALIHEIESHGDYVLRRSDDLKTFLALVQQNSAPGINSRWDSEARDARALAVVCTMAELESFTRYVIQETHRAINASQLPISGLRWSLRQLAAHATFESLRELNDHSKLWERRKYTTTLELCSDPAVLPINHKQAQPPLDGKTLKPEHFNRIWEIYGLSGAAFPISSWSASLVKMSNLRNDVAHGNIPYIEIFQQAGRTVAEIERYVNDLGEFVVHLTDSWGSYLSRRGYLAA